MNLIKNSQGFSLIEVIAAIVLSAIISAAAGMGIVNVAKGLVFARQNASTAVKTQVALNRIEKEFHITKKVISGTNVSLNYTNNRNGVPSDHTLAYSANTIKIDNDILIDNIANFSFIYRDTYDGAASSSYDVAKKIIEINFGVTGAQGVISSFTIKTAPMML